MKKSIWPAHTSYCNVPAWPCTTRCVTPFLRHSHSPANSLATPFLYHLHPVLQCPVLGSSSDRARSQLCKPAGAALHKCPGLKQWSLNATYSHNLFLPLLPMSVPALAGYALCSRSSSVSAAVLSCSSHRHQQKTLRDKMPETSPLPGSPLHLTAALVGQSGLAPLPPSIVTITCFTLLRTMVWSPAWGTAPQPWDKNSADDDCDSC